MDLRTPSDETLQKPKMILVDPWTDHAIVSTISSGTKGVIIDQIHDASIEMGRKLQINYPPRRWTNSGSLQDYRIDQFLVDQF